jgi:hypothetical protein
MGATLCFFATLYLLDISYWQGNWVYIKYSCFGMGGVGMIFYALLCANFNPAAPLTVFCILLVAYTRAVSALFFPHVSRPDFLIGISRTLFATGFVVLVVWSQATISAEGSVIWTADVKRDLQRRSGCEEEAGCVFAYVVWGGPVLGCFACCVIATFARFLGHALQLGSQDENADERRSILGMGAARIIIGTVVAIGFGMWCAASVAVSGSALSNSIFGLTIISATALVAMVSSAVGWDSIRTSIGSNPLVQKIAGLQTSDWIKALAVLVCWLPFMLYLCISVVNQSVRRISGGAFSSEAKAEGGQFIHYHTAVCLSACLLVYLCVYLFTRLKSSPFPFLSFPLLSSPFLSSLPPFLYFLRSGSVGESGDIGTDTRSRSTVRRGGRRRWRRSCWSMGERWG